jgi:hypothetical protein
MRFECLISHASLLTWLQHLSGSSVEASPSHKRPSIVADDNVEGEQGHQESTSRILRINVSEVNGFYTKRSARIQHVMVRNCIIGVRLFEESSPRIIVRPLNRFALAILSQVVGLDHPNTATDSDDRAYRTPDGSYPPAHRPVLTPRREPPSIREAPALAIRLEFDQSRSVPRRP